jgi:glycosyltransferase involved in cell wall biosynthesis
MGAGLEVERTVDDLAAALRNLLTDAIKRRRMGVAARHLAHQRFTWERVAAQLIDLYRRSIAPSQTTP